MKPIQIRPLSALAGAAALTAVLGLTSMMQAGAGGATRIPMITTLQEEILSHLSIVYLPDGAGGTNKTIRMSGVNLQIVNGLGATNGLPTDPSSTDPALTRTNGLGNLIVGYDEVAGVRPSPFRTGSHNIVLGQRQSYTSFGGLLGGRGNTVAAPYGSIVGGEDNLVDAAFSAILGGLRNKAIDSCWNAVGGGADNVAQGQYSWVAGGQFNTAVGDHSAVGGGLGRRAVGPHDWVAGSLMEDE